MRWDVIQWYGRNVLRVTYISPYRTYFLFEPPRNERLFCELHKAYADGRSDKCPAEGWYDGELGFFDFYIIPLAKKLAECGVFGVSSEEYLNYAVANRAEWEVKGRSIVAGYMEKYKH